MVKKVFLTLLIILILLVSNLKISYANFELEIEPMEKIAFNPDDWNPTQEVNNTKLSKTVVDKIGPILGAIQTIGAVISVLALMIIGIKTMLGSVEEKSQYKEALPGYLIGVFLVFSFTTIPNIIYRVMK